MALTDLTALQALAELRAGTVSSEDLTRAYLERIRWPREPGSVG